jgi:integrase
VILPDLPGLSNNITYNGLWATRHVITPVEMGPFEAEQADALRRDLDKIAANFAVEIDLSLVLPNKVDTWTALAEEYLDAFRVEYPERIAPEHVPYLQDIRNATERGETAFAPDDPLVDLTERGVRAVVKRTADHAVAETADDDFQYVSSHDLRRRFAQRLLVDRQMNPRAVMQVGGWDSFQAIEPYLNAPTPEVVNDAFEDDGLAYPS